jgi:hypothetical protein
MNKLVYIYSKVKVKLNKILFNFTLAKFCGAVITIILVAMVKYSISGNFHLEYCEFWNNVGMGLLGWTINTVVISWLTEYLGIKGFNFNLNHLLYGYNTIPLGGNSSYEELKVKLYNAMESDKDLNSGKGLDKGKGIDRGSPDNKSFETESDSESMPLDKDNDRTGDPTYAGNKRKSVSRFTLGTGSAVEPYMANWYRLHPGVDPQVFFFPKKNYFAPGFNVPGGEVPIRDEICKHIDYNTHILSQFKKMDLETAVQQRSNNFKLASAMQTKIAYAEDVLSKIPTIPTTEYEFKLKNQILKDLEELNRNKVRAEARATLLNSRIQFIEINRNSNEQQ